VFVATQEDSIRIYAPFTAPSTVGIAEGAIAGGAVGRGGRADHGSMQHVEV